MSRLSRPNAFHGLPSWFCSSRLTELACKFCSGSLHATDPSYKLPTSHRKNIKQMRNGYYIHNLQCGSFSSARGSASGNLVIPPAFWHFGLFGNQKCLLVLAVTHQPVWLLYLILLDHSGFVLSFSILHVHPTPSIIILFRLTGSHIMNIFAAQQSHLAEWMPEWYFPQCHDILCKI